MIKYIYIKDKTRVPRIAPKKSLLKGKLNSIGVLNIGTQCQSKDRDKIQTETSSENTKRMGDQPKNSVHDWRPAQKSMQL